jgi:hypothetical protein
MPQDQFRFLMNVLQGLEETQRPGHSGKEVAVDAGLGHKLRTGNRKQQLQAVLEMPLLLNHMKIVAWDEGSQHYQSWRLLGDERWETEPDGGMIYYESLDHSWELRNGYLDAYRDAWRDKCHARSLRHCLTKAPLLVCHSAWLDLSGYDLLIYLRMQQASQWLLNCMDLNGVFYASLATLLDGIPEQALKRQEGSVLDKCYGLLQRLMKQLMDHGAMKPLSGFESYPFDPIPGSWEGTAIAWQLADGFAVEEEALVRTGEAASYFAKRFLTDCDQTLLKVMPFADPELVLRVAREVKSLRLEDAALHAWLHRHPDSQIYLVSALFCEWSIRGPSTGKFALPAAIKDSLLAPLLDPSSSISMTERYQRFSAMLLSQGFYRDFICTQAGATVTNLEFGESHDQYSTAAEVVGRVALVELPTQLSPEGSPAESAALTLPPVVETNPKVHSFSKAAQARLEKIAADELERLIQAHPKKYQDLLGQFFTSLDADSKKMLGELRQSLKKDLFEQHIRKRVIQYMLTRPADWTNSAARSL